MSNIAKKSFLIMASNVIAALVGFVALTSMTRMVGPEYGSMMWAMSFVATFNAVSDLGFSHAHVKRISEGKDLDSCFSTFAVLKAGLGGLMIVITLGFIFAYSMMMGHSIHGASMDLLLLFVLYWALCDLSHIFIVTYNAKMESSKSEMIHLADPLVRAPILVLIALQGGSAVHLGLGYVIGALCMVLMGIWLMRRDRMRFRRPLFVRSYLQFAKPLIAITIATALLANLDKVLLGFFWDDMQVGFFSASYKIIELVITFGLAVNVLLFPTFSEWHSSGRRNEIGPLSHEAQRLISIVGMPIVCFLFAFARPICGIILGSDFAPAGDALRFMSVALYLTLVVGVLEQVVLAYGRPELAARAFTLRILVGVSLLFLLIPESLGGYAMAGMKAGGAALAYLGGILAYGGSIAFSVRKISGIRSYRRLWTHVLAGGLMMLSLGLLAHHFPITGALHLILMAGLALVVFLGILALMRELKRQDIELLLSVLNPRSMLRYIRDENVRP